MHFIKRILELIKKTKFPDAQVYAKQVASYFSKKPELDPNNFFYTGFSYGGHAANVNG